MDHDTLVAFPNAGGLFHLMILAGGPLALACGPSTRPGYPKAARDIIDDEDQPWR